MYFPAMLRLRRQSAVTAMMDMTRRRIRQRIWVEAVPVAAAWSRKFGTADCEDALVGIFKRLFGRQQRQLDGHSPAGKSTENRTSAKEKAGPERPGLRWSNLTPTR